MNSIKEDVISVAVVNDYAIVKVNNEKLDGDIAQSLKSEFISLNTKSINSIIVDLSPNRYCDSSGLSALLVGNRLCKNAGGKFFISSLQDSVHKLIQISQLDSVLFITPSVNEAEVKLMAS